MQSLAAEVREAAYTDIADVVAFVSWLDEELSFLVITTIALLNRVFHIIIEVSRWGLGCCVGG